MNYTNGMITDSRTEIFKLIEKIILYCENKKFLQVQNDEIKKKEQEKKD